MSKAKALDPDPPCVPQHASNARTLRCLLLWPPACHLQGT